MKSITLTATLSKPQITHLPNLIESTESLLIKDSDFFLNFILALSIIFSFLLTMPAVMALSLSNARKPEKYCNFSYSYKFVSIIYIRLAENLTFKQLFNI